MHIMDNREASLASFAIVLMGPAGAGKTTVGERLAQSLGWVFVEGDDLHPPENIAKMRSGVPLTDADRLPWLEAVRRRIEQCLAEQRGVVVACSALRRRYRRHLCTDPSSVRFVYLKGAYALLRDRLADRRGHFLPKSLLESQLRILEEPTDVLVVDASLPPDVIAADIRAAFNL